MSDTPASPPTFHIGLTAAGAVSAGAYTAGVLDLLFEALDAMEAAQDAGDPAVPTHRVKLGAMVGASAGAMNAAIVAAWAQRDFPAVTATTIADPAARARNPFAWAWVDQPDIARLLDTGDLADGAVRSLLNGAWLDRVVDQLLSPTGSPGGLAAPAARRRKWIEGLRVRMTVGNLTGTPYLLIYEGTGAPAGGMTDHAQSMDFLLGPPGEKDPPSYLPLTTAPAATQPLWAALGQAALASGAFPAALPFRVLTREADLRAPRRVFVPDRDNPGEAKWEGLPAAWKLLDDPPTYTEPDRARFLCVDGGIANNEPTDLCREALEFSSETQRPVGLADVSRAMIMVDPFPDPPKPGPRDDTTPLTAVLAGLLGAWKNQARFRPTDIWLAARSDVFSRKMIAPSRGDRDKATQQQLAGGPLDGFFGFFHQPYRAHDYLLGRRNCRSFLQRHFAVPVDNTVVKHWAMAEGGGPSDLARQVMRDHGLAEADGKVPLVWLAPALRQPDAAPEPAWPKAEGIPRFEPQALFPAIRTRVGRVLRQLGRQRGRAVGTLVWALGWIPAWLLARQAVAKLTQVRDEAGL